MAARTRIEQMGTDYYLGGSFRIGGAASRCFVRGFFCSNRKGDKGQWVATRKLH